ncbi:MAG: MoaD family protein [Actinomycetota bacterium]|nr:MoaD family protein [Actinomycetota bacterium]
MTIEVRIPTVFRKFTDEQAVVEVEPATIGEVIDQLEQRFPELKGQIRTEAGGLHRFVNVYLNDEDVRYLEKLDTKASEGDTLSLLPSVAGGLI